VPADDGVDLCLGFAHHVGVEGHGEHEHRECGGCLGVGSGKRRDGAGECGLTVSAPAPLWLDGG